ncbi:uncharacterized protein LOC128554388 isoform X2 [Mercenaria mercenaria]|uniref:uncharacterized protein LOC128554388 isoform X2 n=1 Tax=Mercenaria mercenaria TaxID=6596 RepID=UPI00234F1207|nr:uncharacterized protein LOC128554388 isoform X2 [Mercenaria mercenaria]
MTKDMDTFWILDFLVLMLLFQKMFAFTYTSKDGVKFSYNFSFKQSCRGEKNRIGILPGIALPECVKECGMHPHCKALNYRKRYNACYLYSSEENEEDRSKESCIEVKESDIEIKERPGDDNTEDQTCDSSEQTYNKYTECKYNEPPLNGKIVGNMNGVGDRIQYKCDFGYEVPKESEYAVCRSDGSWSVVVDKCTKIDETNVAQDKQTSMSSIYHGHDGTKGIDGNTNQDFGQGSCFHTEEETDPWWQVDLGDIYDIVNVTLFNRVVGQCDTGGCNRATDLSLSIGTTLESMYIVGTVPGPINDIHTFKFPEGKEARYVRVTLEGQNKVLHLCEVQVFGFPIY